MLRFRQMKSLLKFATVHANIHNHFDSDCHLIDSETCKTGHPAVLADSTGGAVSFTPSLC